MDQNDPEMAENGQNWSEMGENDQNGTWMALPDPETEPVEWACWQCQADQPEFTLEIMHEEAGRGWTYRLCHECVERLIGQLEEGKSERG